MRDDRFDEVELVHLDDVLDEAPAAGPVIASVESHSAPAVVVSPAPVVERATAAQAPRFNRILALATDLSLFAAIGLALSPMIEMRETVARTFSEEPMGISSLLAFLLLLSYYYFPLCWMIWGRTAGAALFDLRVVSSDGAAVTAPQAARRWTATLLSLATGLIGFLPGLLPSRRTIADRVSRTHVVSSRD